MGSNTVEFALILPVFVLFLTMAFGGGMLFYAHSTINTYAREAARGVALGYMTESEAKTFAQQNSESALGISVAVHIDPPVVDDADDQDVVVSVSVGGPEIQKLMVFGNLLAQGLQARVTMRSVAK